MYIPFKSKVLKAYLVLSQSLNLSIPPSPYDVHFPPPLFHRTPVRLAHRILRNPRPGFSIRPVQNATYPLALPPLPLPCLSLSYLNPVVVLILIVCNSLPKVREIIQQVA